MIELGSGQVAFECAQCGGASAMSKKDYRDRQRRSASGKVFCSRKCANQYNGRLFSGTTRANKAQPGPKEN